MGRASRAPIPSLLAFLLHFFHSLVPKHEKIGVDEVEYQVGLAEEWPKLYTNDAIAQYYNYKKGDLIRITRTVGCAEPVFYYRLVCSPPSS